jgi:predicted enzyme related to lactoylglutathione lyase
VFYRDKWKLSEVTAQDGMYYFAAEASEEAYVVRLRESATKCVDVIALAASSSKDVDTLHDKVKSAGCRVIFQPRRLTGLGGGYGFRFFSPEGLPFEISSDVTRRAARTLQRGEGVPERTSHIVLHSPKHKDAANFFVNVLGFRLSDWIGDSLAFLRCNEWHHRIAVLPGPPCVNHVAYDMPDIDEMMRGIARLKRMNVELVSAGRSVRTAETASRGALENARTLTSARYSDVASTIAPLRAQAARRMDQ